MLCYTSYNKEGLIGDVNVKGSLGCCDREMVEFRILRRGRRAETRSRLWTTGEHTTLFSDDLGRVPWDKVHEERAAQESWLILKDCLFQCQEQWFPMSRKLGENAKRPAWRAKELLAKLKHKSKHTIGGSRDW